MISERFYMNYTIGEHHFVIRYQVTKPKYESKAWCFFLTETSNDVRLKVTKEIRQIMMK